MIPSITTITTFGDNKYMEAVSGLDDLNKDYILLTIWGIPFSVQN